MYDTFILPSSQNAFTATGMRSSKVSWEQTNLSHKSDNNHVPSK